MQEMCLHTNHSIINQSFQDKPILGHIGTPPRPHHPAEPSPPHCCTVRAAEAAAAAAVGSKAPRSPPGSAPQRDMGGQRTAVAKGSGRMVLPPGPQRRRNRRRRCRLT
ncbi:hypothetical protein E2C01_079139 [Portunus trituberculatus]|uniref:Uncharacterized protein n=1 Tax=Portunus trituberculatus TaxID=210409 RepID=A0A5B7IG71_PORTR|nr:hypothetical protein [Portunus trituberculatus]